MIIQQNIFNRANGKYAFGMKAEMNVNNSMYSSRVFDEIKIEWEHMEIHPQHLISRLNH